MLERLELCLLGGFADTNGLGNRAAHDGRIGDRGQIHEPHPIGEYRAQVGRQGDGQARLARAPWASQREQAHIFAQQPRANRAKLPRAPNQRCRRHWQMAWHWNWIVGSRSSMWVPQRADPALAARESELTISLERVDPEASVLDLERYVEDALPAWRPG